MLLNEAFIYNKGPCITRLDPNFYKTGVHWTPEFSHRCKTLKTGCYICIATK